MVGGKDPVEAALVCRAGHRSREVKRLACVHLAGKYRPDVDAEARASLTPDAGERTDTTLAANTLWRMR